MPPGKLAEAVRKAARLEMSPQRRPPGSLALAAATLVSLAGSLGLNALLVRLGTAAFPATKGFSHFRVFDYGTLTVIGVLAAAAAWTAVARTSSEPRWVFFRLALVVTLASFLADVYLLARGEPIRAVGVLMVMHLAVALVSYNALVRIAPAQLIPSGETPSGVAEGRDGPADGSLSPEGAAGRLSPEGPTGGLSPGISTRRLASALGLLVGTEFILGVTALFFLSPSRPSGWLPSGGKGEGVYLAHALLGLPLALGAVAMAARVRGAPRNDRLSGWIGLVGVALSGGGGLLAADHALRLLGMALMLVGPVLAGFGYAIPSLAAMGEPTVSPTVD